jgi:hypothetical protein
LFRGRVRGEYRYIMLHYVPLPLGKEDASNCRDDNRRNRCNSMDDSNIIGKNKIMDATPKKVRNTRKSMRTSNSMSKKIAQTPVIVEPTTEETPASAWVPATARRRARPSSMEMLKI